MKISPFAQSINFHIFLTNSNKSINKQTKKGNKKMKKSMTSRATAYRVRKVTRTVEVMNLTATAVDLDTKTVVEFPVSIPAVGFRSNKAMENAIIKQVEEKGNYKYVTSTVVDKTYITYAMDESFFMENAKIIATGNDIKNMQPVADETEVEAEAVEEQ